MDRQLKVGFIGAGNMAFGITKGMMSGDCGGWGGVGYRA